MGQADTRTRTRTRRMTAADALFYLVLVLTAGLLVFHALRSPS
jgi:energy-coupling factor transporter transmembrane protein EcfT